MASAPPPPSDHSSPGPRSLSGFPEEDLRSGGRENPGYFPARLGQPLGEQGRFVILRKLGWGDYANVWLARDRKEQSLVALKILNCEGTRALRAEGQDKRSDEVAMLQRLGTLDKTHPGSRHVLGLLDSFEFTGPHGSHTCIVTEALGFSLATLTRTTSDGRLPVRTAKVVMKQVLQAVDYMHTCNIVHTDLKQDNLLLRPPDVAAVVAHELVDDPSYTYACPTEATPSVVPVVSQELPVCVGVLKNTDIDVVVADLGHSHWRDRHFQEIIQPFGLRCPETVLGAKWDTPADIWNLGCLFLEMLVDCRIFEAMFPDEWTEDEQHLAAMTETTEESFSAEFLARCSKRDEYFGPDGTFKHYKPSSEPNLPVAVLLRSRAAFGEDAAEVTACERFIKRLLRLDPAHRSTASELQDDPWLAA